MLYENHQSIIIDALYFFSSLAVGASEMTPHKFTDAEIQGGGSKYDTP